MENLINEFNAITLMKVFEIEVLDNRTNDIDYILFDISIDQKNNTLRAQHVGLTHKEEQSKFIAFKSIELDDCFSLDENLQELLEECTTAIMDSDFYQLAE